MSGGSALGRAIERSMNMNYGWTEMRPLAWVCGRGWSGWDKEARSLIERYDELLLLHDRIQAELGKRKLPAFDTLQDNIDELAKREIDNTPEDRTQAESSVRGLILDARQIELLLSTEKDTAVLPKTAKTARDLEARTRDLASSEGGLPLAVHEVLFKHKTESLEASVGGKIADSNNPKLAPLKGLPPGEYWRFLIDGDAQEKGDKHLYDRSAGYMAGMMSGLDMIVDRIEDPLSIEFIKDLHKSMSEHVTTEGGSNDARRSGVPLKTDLNSFQEQGLKTSWNGWGTSPKGSPEGRAELGQIRDELQAVLSAPPEPAIADPYFVRYDDELKGVKIDKVNVGDRLAKEQIQPAVVKLMKHALDKYQLQLAQAEGNEDRVLDAIIDCCRALGQIHPFKDANGRLIMFGVLSKLLLENGMPPAVLSDQGIMIGQSREQLRAAIRQGQDTIRSLSRT